MNQEARILLNALLERLDMQNGEWPGVEVYTPKNGAYTWGLLPEDVYALLIGLNKVLGKDNGSQED